MTLTVEEIVEGGLCIGCGLCRALAGPGRIDGQASKGRLPIVAIGGITLEHAAEVVEAGADSVAVISDILLAPDPAQRARQYIDLLKAADHAAAV